MPNIDIKYRVRVDKDIPFSIGPFKRFIKKVIHDPKGMRVLFGRGLRLIEVPESYMGDDVKMTINLVSNNDVESIFLLIITNISISNR